jgi:hypothetical protein
MNSILQRARKAKQSLRNSLRNTPPISPSEAELSLDQLTLQPKSEKTHPEETEEAEGARGGEPPESQEPIPIAQLVAGQWNEELGSRPTARLPRGKKIDIPTEPIQFSGTIPLQLCTIRRKDNTTSITHLGPVPLDTTSNQWEQLFHSLWNGTPRVLVPRGFPIAEWRNRTLAWIVFLKVEIGEGVERELTTKEISTFLLPVAKTAGVFSIPPGPSYLSHRVLCVAPPSTLDYLNPEVRQRFH